MPWRAGGYGQTTAWAGDITTGARSGARVGRRERETERTRDHLVCARQREVEDAVNYGEVVDTLSCTRCTGRMELIATIGVSISRETSLTWVAS